LRNVAALVREGVALDLSTLDGMPFGHPMRALFQLEPDMAFLNNGSYGACPTAVLDAQDEIRRGMERQPVAFFAHFVPGQLRAAAARLAEFLGAPAEEIVFVENATAGMNAVLRSLSFAPGDEIVTTDHVYGAVRQVLTHLERKAGVRIVEVGLAWPARDAESIVASVERALTPRTRLLVIDHIASRSGMILPVAELAELARARGVRVLVDGAHAPGQLAFEAPSLGADWVIGNCHKWLYAPKGSAFLWAHVEAQEDLHPGVISHGYGKGFTAEFDWVGTRDPSAWLAVPAAIAFFEALGPARVRSRNHALAMAMAETLANSWGTEIGAPHEMFGAMTTIRLPGARAASVEAGRNLRRRLWTEHRVEVPIMFVGDALWARISAQIFNVPQDYVRLAKAIGAMS